MDNDLDLEEFEISSSDETLQATFETWLKDSQTYHDYLLTFQKISQQYYEGNQTDRDLIVNGNTNTVENRIFEAVETITPIVTSRPHQFLVLPGSEDEKSVARASSLQKVLTRKYETLEMQRKLEDVTRDILLYRFGVMKWEWGYESDDVDVKGIDPRLMLIPRLRMDPHDLPYKMEIQQYSKKDMEEYFPEIDIDQYAQESLIDVGTEPNKATKKCYRVYEVWTSEMVAWFCDKKILTKMPNPYWDFKGREKKYVDVTVKKNGKQRAKIRKELVFSNIFDRPTDPYVFFTTYKVGDEPIGSISLAEVGIPIQDLINTGKRRINDNLRRMGNGQVYVDNDAMSQELADNITDEVGLIIRGEGVASQNKVRREPGTPLPIAHFTNLQHSEQVFDNIMGVHGATRGAGGGKTLGQDIISRQQDFTRVDLITRVLNRGVARIAMGLVQLMKMYYDSTKVVKILGEEGAIEFVRLNRDEIDDHIEIIVKSGESLPMDKVSLRTEAVQLWQLGALDPVTLFERLEFPNPAKAAERLQAWKTGQLTAETQAKIAEIAASAKFGNAALPPKDVQTPTGETGAKVETPANVIQRATAGLGGGTPTLPGIPKL